MNSLTYLLIRSTKNRFLEIIRTPSKAIPYVLVIGFFVFLVITNMMTGAELPYYHEYTSPLFLKGILFGFFMFTFAASVAVGLKGSDQYGMQDVNLLFVSPIRSRTILIYGLVQSTKTILIGSWFVFFQIGWLQSSFGVSLGGVFLIWAGYVLFTLVCQMLSIFLYAILSGCKTRQLVAKIVLALMFLPVFVLFLINAYAYGEIGPGFYAALGSWVFDYTPFVGWASAGIVALITGHNMLALWFFGMLFVVGVSFVLIVYLLDPEFYEQVSGATQDTFNTIQSVQEGNVQSSLSTNRKIKITKTGLAGSGSSVLFYKHVRESFRRNYLGLWDFTSIFIVGGAVIWAFFARPGEPRFDEYYEYLGPYDGSSMIISMFFTVMIMKLFGLGGGRGAYELYSHYIFMLPDSAFYKWIWANWENVIKALVEGVFIFGLAGVVLSTSPYASASPLIVVSAILAYVVFIFYSVGIDLAFLRISGFTYRSMFLAVLTMFMTVIPMLPGIIAAFFALNILPDSIAVTVFLLIVSVWNLIVGLVCFVISQDVLHNCDMPTMDKLVGAK